MRRLLLSIVLVAAAAPAEAQERPSLDALAAQVEASPTDAELRRQLAARYTEEDQAAQAIPHLAWLAEQDPQDVAIRRTLAQHLEWTDQPRQAADVLEQILVLTPEDLGLRLKIVEMITWTGGADRAVGLMESAAVAHPDSARVQAAYAYALHAADDLKEARAQYRRALAVAPDDAALHLEAGALERWSGDWSVARQWVRRAQTLGLDADRARRASDLLDGLALDYGPTLSTETRYVVDSNGLTRVSAPVALAITLNPRWTVGVEVGHDRLVRDVADAADPNASATGLGGSVAYSPTRSLTLTSGLATEATPGGRVAVRARAGVRQVWTGRVFASIQAQAFSASATDGVDALGRGLRFSQGVAEGYVELPIGLAASASASAGRYSDGNGRLALGGTLRQTLAAHRVPGAAPTTAAAVAGGVAVGALYEDTETVYPDARPYYTPEALTTLRAGLFGSTRLATDLSLDGDVGVLRQANPTAASISVFYRVAGSARFGRHRVLAEVGRTGSNVYSAETVFLRYQVGL